MPQHLIDRTGEVNIAKNGLQMTIVGYRSTHDIDVQFEDGAIVKNKRYSSFKHGLIAHPDIPHATPFRNRVGATNVATNGMKMTIVKYLNNQNIDVQFEDGTVIHCAYDSFIRGNVANPNFLDIKHVGETNIAKNGLKMTIIKYRKYTDLDVQFEDGIIVEHRTYHNFKLGDIAHPEYQHNQNTNRVGMNKISSNGLKMTIIAYRTANDMDIQFEDGYILRHQQYWKFESGHIRRRMRMPFQIENVIATAYAYTYDHMINYYCQCQKCNFADIMTIQEMRDHICNK